MASAPYAPRLAGRVALVTGGSRGIGAAVARRLGAEGAAVAVAHEPRDDRRREAEAVVTELVARHGADRAIAVPADLADPSAPAQLVATVGEQLGGLDVLVANAAASGRADWQTLTVEEWDLVQQVNVRGAWLLARAAVPELARRGHGSIINVTSVMVQTGAPGSLHYSVSKAAVIGLTRTLSREVGALGIRVNAVMPGAIRTEEEIERGLDPEVVAERLLAVQALQRRGTAEDVAGAFAFLAGDDSCFVTGQVINVDGGWIHY